MKCYDGSLHLEPKSHQIKSHFYKNLKAIKYFIWCLFFMEITITKLLTIKNIVIWTEYEDLLIKNGNSLASIQTLNMKSEQAFTITTDQDDEYVNSANIPFEISWDRFNTYWFKIKWSVENQTITLFIKY